MTTYKDLVNIKIAEIDLIKNRSLINHQYLKNISESGALVEYEIRQMLNRILPSRFRATHGYIASARSRTEEPVISPQVDCIIVDTMVPNSLYKISGNLSPEIIPLEAVVGVFEIKRTLNKRSLLGTNKSKGAFEHLNNICESVGIVKTNQERYLSSGFLMDPIDSGGYFSNPILGVLGLATTKDMLKTDEPENTNSFAHYYNAAPIKSHIDMVTSLGDFLFVTCSENNSILPITNIRPDHQSRHTFRRSGSGLSRESLISSSLGFIQLYLTKVCGRTSNLHHYYFNTSIE